MYGDIARLAISHNDMQHILECTTDWKDIGDIVDRVCATKLGFGMFAWAQAHVTAAKVAELMSCEISKLGCLDSIGEKEVAHTKQNIMDIANSMVGISGLPSRLDGSTTNFGTLPNE